jgi:hypothetical protein
LEDFGVIIFLLLTDRQVLERIKDNKEWKEEIFRPEMIEKIKRMLLKDNGWTIVLERLLQSS